MNDTVLRVMRNVAVWGDLVINELMFDPEPEVSISMGEYVELFSRSEYPLDLEGWILVVGERRYELGGTSQGDMIEPGDYRLLTQISLPNHGSLLALYNSAGALVHAARYRIP